MFADFFPAHKLFFEALVPEMCCPVQRHNVLLDLWSFTVDWHLQELSPNFFQVVE